MAFEEWAVRLLAVVAEFLNLRYWTNYLSQWARIPHEHTFATVRFARRVFFLLIGWPETPHEVRLGLGEASALFRSRAKSGGERP